MPNPRRSPYRRPPDSVTDRREVAAELRRSGLSSRPFCLVVRCGQSLPRFAPGAAERLNVIATGSTLQFGVLARSEWVQMWTDQPGGFVDPGGPGARVLGHVELEPTTNWSRDCRPSLPLGSSREEQQGIRPEWSLFVSSCDPPVPSRVFADWFAQPGCGATDRTAQA